MTGPEHYLEAERLLAVSDEIPSNNDNTNPVAALVIAEAQVRATLALAAATALNGTEMGHADGVAWMAVAATARPDGPVNAS